MVRAGSPSPARSMEYGQLSQKLDPGTGISCWSILNYLDPFCAYGIPSGNLMLVFHSYVSLPDRLGRRHGLPQGQGWEVAEGLPAERLLRGLDVEPGAFSR